MNNGFNNIKMIVSDLDHTILPDEFTIDMEYAQTFRKLKEKGYIIVVASARGFYQSYIFSQYLIPNYTICDNGASTVRFDYDRHEKHVIHQSLIPEETRIDILNSLVGYDTLISVIESGNDIYITKNKYNPKFVSDYAKSYLDAKRTVPEFNVHQVDGLEDIPFDLPLTRIAVFDHVMDPKTHEHLENLGRKHPEIRYSRSFSTTFEYGCSDKGEALRNLTEDLRLQKENVISFGDGLTDIKMFEESGISVAVRNASEKVRESADIVCDDVFSMGVNRFLKENFLG